MEALRQEGLVEAYPPPGLEVEPDRFESLVAEFGLAHEQNVLATFPDFVEASSAEHTQRLIKAKTLVIYQPELIDHELGLVGRPDFLLLRENGEYQIADAKLANSLKGHPEIRIQLGCYRRLLKSNLPAIAYLGSSETEEVGDEASADVEKFISSMQSILSKSSPPPTHFSDSKCKVCPYDKLCRKEFEKNEEITLVYGVDARSAPGLKAQGISTISDLAKADPSNIQDVPYIKGYEKKQKVCLQAKSFLLDEIYQLAPVELRNGVWIHFDVEVNPLDDNSPIYIWGLLPPGYQRSDFEYIWSDQDEDERAWSEFLAKVESYRLKYSEIVLAHFSSYERTQIKNYAEKYSMLDHPTVSWLLSEDSPLVDLLEVVKQSLVLPVYGYGLKTICKNPELVNFQWDLKESGSQWSVVRYLDYLQANSLEEKEKIKQEIISYNRDDVRATRALEVWLRERYAE